MDAPAAISVDLAFRHDALVPVGVGLDAILNNPAFRRECSHDFEVSPGVSDVGAGNDPDGLAGLEFMGCHDAPILSWLLSDGGFETAVQPWSFARGD
jgi:hypothetical protein